MILYRRKRYLSPARSKTPEDNIQQELRFMSESHMFYTLGTVFPLFFRFISLFSFSQKMGTHEQGLKRDSCPLFYLVTAGDENP